MKQKKSGWIVWVVLVSFSALVHAQQHNILLLIGDDIGLDSLPISNTSTNGSYPPVPNLENLAQNGILFSNGYAYPTCSPTRSSILTGRYGYRTGVLSPQSAHNFSASEVTIPEIFADQGLPYELASFGKWHLGGSDTGPNELGGWPHFSGSLGGGLSPNYRRWTKTVDGASALVTYTYATSENVEDAIGWINTQGTNNWFAWIGFNAAHTPLHTPPPAYHTYDLSGLDTTNHPRSFYEAMVETMDNRIGWLLNQIDTNETTIIFLGDNGTAADVIQPPYDINQRAKGSLYEGGTHVPFLICGAEVVNGGRTNDSVVHCADLFATIIELAGGSPPASGADSRSLIPILQDQAFLPAEECILVEADTIPGPGDTGRAVRNSQYKLIRIDEADNGFFDLLADPLEATNLLSAGMTSAQSSAYSMLSAKLSSWTNQPSTVVIPTNGYPLVDTGQLNCYDDTGGYTISAPVPGAAFAGQDAQYTGNIPLYQDNGDTTVTDLNTGLMWQQTPDLVTKTSWSNAVDDAVNQTTAGYSDWRLPSLKELYSLIHFSGETGQSQANAIPYINTNYFDFAYGDTNTERYIDAQYWTSTEYAGLTMVDNETVFGVNFADGRIKGYPKSTATGGDNLSFVRYVRGNTSYGSNDFYAAGDGTVLDRATGLIWQQGDSIVTQNWEQALAYAEGLELAGYRDWRLPNAKELQSIVDYTRAPLVTGTAAIDTNYFDVTETESYFWTSTTHMDGAPLTTGNYAVYLCFGQAYGWMPVPPNQTNTYVRYDVHGAGAQRSDPKSGTPIIDGPSHAPQGDDLRIYNYARCVRGGVAAPADDSDGDGLSDWYEYAYSGGITNMDAAADTDSDGVSNGDENLAGTIPTVASSRLEFTDQVIETNGNIVVKWSSELDRSYRLNSSSNLLSDAFSTLVASNLPATPPVNSYATEPATAHRFYQIEVE